MKIVKPFRSTLQDANGNNIEYFCKILSTNALDEELDEYDSSSTYAVKSEVKIDSLKRKYRSKIEDNGDYPVGSINWVDMGALNSYSGFDNHIFSQTISTEDLEIEIDVSLATTVAIFNMQNITNLTIEHTNIDTDEIVTIDVNLRDYGAYSLYEYFYTPIKNKKQHIQEIEWIPNAKVKFSIPANGNEIAYGMILSGLSEDTGITLYSGEIGQIDYSIFETDAWGNTTFNKRAVANTLDAKILVDEENIDTVMDLSEDVRASLNLFIGDERDRGIQRMNIVGYLKSSKIPITPNKMQYDMKIVGVK